MRVFNNPIDRETTNKIENITKSKIVSATSLVGGCVAKVYRINTEDNKEYVAKICPTGEQSLAVEGDMLRYLREKTNLPTCNIFYYDDFLFLQEYIVTNEKCKNNFFEESVAEELAKLHKISNDYFGFEKDTLIGGITQPNKPNKDWINFFVNERLLYMAKKAYESEQLPLSVYKKVEILAENIDKYIENPKKPSLIHGDIWSGNVLCDKNKKPVFIDPAIYFADNEIEFTFATVWGSFGESFFKRYNEINPIKDEYFEVRRHIYNLYPLLVHTKLFGTSYAIVVDATVSRFI